MKSFISLMVSLIIQFFAPRNALNLGTSAYRQKEDIKYGPMEFVH
jgi:hypothetical protein